MSSRSTLRWLAGVGLLGVGLLVFVFYALTGMGLVTMLAVAANRNLTLEELWSRGRTRFHLVEDAAFPPPHVSGDVFGIPQVAHRLERYVGVYEDAVGRLGTVAVSLEQGQLVLDYVGELPGGCAASGGGSDRSRALAPSLSPKIRPVDVLDQNAHVASARTGLDPWRRHAAIDHDLHESRVV